MILGIFILVIIAFSIWALIPRTVTPFLEPDELEKVLMSDQDGYISNMSQEDLKRRGLPGPLPKWTTEQKRIVLGVLGQTHMDFSHIWFGIIDDTREGGMPHTRSNTIVLSTKTLAQPENQIMRTIIHEFIHIQQKRFPNLFEKLYRMWDFSRYHGKLPQELVSTIRNNPDTEGLWIWKNQYVMLPIYLEKHGMNTAYVVYNIETGTIDTNTSIKTQFGPNATQPEHPAELSATILAEYIIKKDLSSPTRYENLAIEWYKEHDHLWLACPNSEVMSTCRTRNMR